MVRLSRSRESLVRGTMRAQQFGDLIADMHPGVGVDIGVDERGSDKVDQLTVGV